MKKFFGEFKEFAMRGNVIDLAVGVILGSAFSAIVTALVDNILMPIIGLIVGQVNIATLSVSFGDALTLPYGAFLQAILNFIIIAFCIFLFVKGISKLHRKKPEPPKPPVRICEFCKQEVALDATRCPHCTSHIPLPEEPRE